MWVQPVQGQWFSSLSLIQHSQEKTPSSKFPAQEGKKKKGRKKKKKGGGSTGIEPSNLRPLTTLPAPYGSDLRPLALPLGPLPSPYRNDLRPLETLPHGRPKSCRGAATGRHRSGDGAARRQGEGKRKERKKKKGKRKKKVPMKTH